MVNSPATQLVIDSCQTANHPKSKYFWKMQTANTATCSFLDMILPFVVATFGAGVATTKKMQFQTKVPGLNDVTHPFRKPWFVSC